MIVAISVVAVQGAPLLAVALESIPSTAWQAMTPRRQLACELCVRNNYALGEGLTDHFEGRYFANPGAPRMRTKMTRIQMNTIPPPVIHSTTPFTISLITIS